MTTAPKNYIPVGTPILKIGDIEVVLREHADPKLAFDDLNQALASFEIVRGSWEDGNTYRHAATGKSPVVRAETRFVTRET